MHISQWSKAIPVSCFKKHIAYHIAMSSNNIININSNNNNNNNGNNNDNNCND